MVGVSWVTVRRFAELTGYTRDAIYTKVKRGVWPEGAFWRKAPDGRVLLSLEAYNRWVENRLG